MQRSTSRALWASLIVLSLVGLAYWASPYVAVARLARDLEAGNSAEAAARIEFPSVRGSIARQIARAYLEANPQIARASPLGPQAAQLIAAGAVDAYISQTFTPEIMTTWLASGRPPPGLGEQAETRTMPSLATIKSAWDVFQQAGFTGLSSFAVRLQTDANAQAQLNFGVRSATWRLISVNLPKPWIDRLVTEVTRRSAQQAPATN
jgi:hypothetical protein